MTKTEDLKKLSILDVARQLGLELERAGHDRYLWVDHPSLVISPSRNIFAWFSRDKQGDVFAFIQAIKEHQTGQPVTFKEAKRYLETGEFEQAQLEEYVPPVFDYYLAKYESSDLTKAKTYLMAERGLSEETVDLFIERGLIAQATKKTEEVFEPVIVFKTFDKTGKLTGASLQGIVENRDLHERGRLKQIMKASDGMSGLTVDIGTPKRLVFAESPIDLMSYYDLHKGKLTDVRLVAMDGLKEATVSRHFAELWTEKEGRDYTVDRKLTPKVLEKTATLTNILQENPDLITLAVDNDEAGRRFITKLQKKNIPVVIDLPPLQPGQEKNDWNDYLKDQKGHHMEEQDNSRLAQAKRKLERLENELVQATQAAFVHQAQTNGQPMNDKRGNSAFFKRRDQLEDKAIALTREIESQKERIEDLEWQEERKERGLNRKGSGLDMSVANIPRIREEIERFYRGESFYTRATIKNYEKKLVELEAMAAQQETVTISLGAQYLIDQNLVNQWAKQPSFYFVQGQRGLALQLQEDGTFALGAKYRPKTPEQVAMIEELLDLAKTQEKSLEETQGIVAETKLGDFPDKQGAAPLPEANLSQPLNDMSPHQTRSQPLLQFTISGQEPSTHKNGYHPIRDKELRKLNRYVPNIQQAADWYLNNLAETQLTYVYTDGKEAGKVTVDFGKEHFMHLTGIFPVREGQTAEQTLEDFAQGRLNFDHILIANQGAAFSKLQVLPELQEVIESDAFYFSDLSDVEKLHRLDLDKAIRTADKDLLLALRTVDGTTLPASVMKLKASLNAQIDQSQSEKIILGVYQNRDGSLSQLSINETYIKDGGKEMLAILENQGRELADEQPQLLPRQEVTTRLLDTIRELGRPVLNVRPNPDHALELAQIDKLLEQYQGNLDLVITDLTLADLVDTQDEFYQNWVADKVFEAHKVSWSDVANGQVSQDKFHELASQTMDDLMAKRENFFSVQEEVTTPDSELTDPTQVGTDPELVQELIANKDTKALAEHMKAGIRTYLQSDQYREFLTAMGKLPHYSFNNLMLLKAQKLDLSAVASASIWRSKFGRLINKGETALRVWAPMTITKKDPETGKPLLDEEGKPVTYTTFRLVPVFDLSQTNGRDFPRAVNQLEGTHEDFAKLYRSTKALAQELGASVEVAELPDTKHGYYSAEQNKIVLRKGMSEVQTLKTFFHELAHLYLHNDKALGNQDLKYSTKELQAESVAFVIASHFGIDTSSYSFGYLGAWSDDKEHLRDLEAQLGIVQKSAQVLIQRLDDILEIQQDRTKPQDKLAERLSQAKSQDKEQSTQKEATPPTKKQSSDPKKDR